MMMAGKSVEKEGSRAGGVSREEDQELHDKALSGNPLSGNQNRDGENNRDGDNVAVAGSISLEEQLDVMARQLNEITAELSRQREERSRWSELVADVMPLAQQSMTTLTSNLEEDAFNFDDLASLGHALVRNANILESWLGPLRVMAALAEEIGPLMTPAVSSLNERLAELDERGYFSKIREAIGIVDNVVASFSDEDVKLLGDNIVLILQTVKQMTQPEIMGMLGRAAVTLQEESPDSSSKVPSARALLKQMRDPMVRRGMSRLLSTLRSIGADSSLDGVGHSLDPLDGVQAESLPAGGLERDELLTGSSLDGNAPVEGTEQGRTGVSADGDG